MEHPASPPFPCEPIALSYFDEAPVRASRSVELPVSPARLFAIFADPASWPKWVPGIGSVHWTSPEPFEVGTTRTVVFWGGMEVYELFTHWEDGREMAFHFTGTNQEVWKAFGEHYLVEDLGDGRSRLTWRMAFETAGTAAKVFPLVGWMLGPTMSLYMTLLKRYCARHRAPAAQLDAAK